MPEDQGSSESQNEPTVNVQLVSPSAGFTQPLSFSNLAASTTIQQLRAKIREAVPARPTDDQLRLIHRGHLLRREDDTLRDVFGLEALRSGDQQTLHVVLKDGSNNAATPASGSRPPSTLPVPTMNLSRTPQSTTQANVTQPVQPQAQHGFTTHFGPVQHPQGLPHPPIHLPTPAFGPSAGPQAAMAAQVAALHQHQHNLALLHARNQMHRAAAQQQAAHATEQGGQSGSAASSVPHSTGGFSLSPAAQSESGATQLDGGAAPQTTTTVHTWQSVLNGPRPLGAHEVQELLRSADATSIFGAAAAGRLTGHTPGTANGLGATARQTSDTGPAGGGQPQAAQEAAQGQTQEQRQPEVYILSSPSGPRALLVNQATAEAYYSAPTARATGFMPLMPFGLAPSRQPFPYPLSAPNFGTLLPPPPLPPQRQTRIRLRNRASGVVPEAQGAEAQRPRAAAEQGAQPAQADAAAGAAPAQQQAPENARPGGAAWAAMWPHLWLLVRLAAFVWWFTSGDSSWYRLITIVSLALAMFLVNTGVLNPLADQVWGPFRRHLDGLIPFGDPNQPANGALDQVPAVPALPNEAHAGAQADAAVDVVAVAAPDVVAPHQPAAPAAEGEPNPVEAAARLVAQRREANANWLMNQVRRVERASLLFLASIAPGVAERHIAHMEAEARAAAEQRRRQQREAEEQAGREQAAAQGTAEAANTAAGSSTGMAAESAAAQGAAVEEQQNPEQVPQEPAPVIPM